MCHTRVLPAAALLAAALFTLPFQAGAQDPRGAIVGRITDSTDAFIPAVTVRATNAETGVVAAGQSNAAGSYSIPFLLPGTYQVSAETTGFKKFVREGIQVRVAERVELNIQMEVGAVTETVEVRAETPLLDTAGSSLGQVVDQRRVNELPIAAGNPLELILLTPGITEPSKFLWKPAWNFRQITADGNGPTNNEFTIDGVSNTFAEGNAGRSRYAFSPPASAVREFKMETSPYDASTGHSIGATVNVSTVGGTNELHGEAHWFVRNKAFDAPNFFNNKRGTEPAVYQDNRYGASAGGPVVLPRLYNGKNKTFWFYAYEANKWGVPSPFTGTVPSAAIRAGDFSELLALNSSYQVYDPATIAVAPGGRFSRQPFPGNVIPTSRLDPVGAALADLYPMPNQPGTPDGRNNYFNGGLKALEDYYVHLARVDHAFSDSHRMFVRVHYDWWEEDKNRHFSNSVNGIILNRTNRGLTLDDVFTLSPTLVVNLRYGLTHQDFPEERVSRGFDLASIGFSQNLVSQLVDKSLATLPRVTNGYSTISPWESGDGTTTSMTHSFAAALTKSQGSHHLKFGADFRVYRAFGNRFPETTAPRLDYSTYWTRGPFDNSPAASIGQNIASQLLGIPDGQMVRSASFAMQDRYLGMYLHDDWKVSPRLTLNVGLRYEYESPVTERFDRLVAGFAFDTPNPIEAQARAAYAQDPIDEISSDNFRVLGGLTWVGADGNPRTPFGADKHNLLPRIGLAYQLLPKTLLRAGYGIYYDTTGVNTTRAIQTGFAQSTPIQPSLDSGLTFIASNADPFPSGLLAPLGPAGGLVTNLGQSIEFYNRDRKHAYSQRWSFGIQQLLPHEFLLEASYVANRGTRLPVVRNYNALPNRYLSTSPVRDNATNNYLTASFPNPFFGLVSTYGATTSRSSLLRPYPAFGNIEAEENIGYSWYHSLQVRAEKRFSQGYTLLLGYTFSKLMEAVEFMNAADAMPYESIGNFDRPHRLSLSGIWELPFGRGRRFGSQWAAPLNFIAGGWQLGGLVVRQAGPPLGFGNVIFDGDLKDIPLPKGQRDVDRWFNIDAGFNRVTAQQLVNNVRTFPLRFSGIRGDGRATWDLSAIKNFSISERATLQFRAECFNAWNHANFNNPNTSVTSSSFGMITGVSTDARNFQFSLKLKF